MIPTQRKICSEIGETAKDVNEDTVVLELRGMTYEERLRALDPPTLEQRRERGELIQVYKLMNGMNVVDNEELLLSDEVTSINIRDRSKKLRMGRSFMYGKN